MTDEANRPTRVDDVDEFSFLAGQASEFGLDVPLPEGERLTLALADGRTISGIRWGGSSPAVTLLHGAGLNAHTWDTTVLALGLPALALDLPGHGDSSWRTDADYRARTIADDVAAAIAAWTNSPQVLVGQSLGGLTAAAVAASHPDLVRDVIVVDITPGVNPAAGPSQVRDFFAGPTDFASRDELVDRALAFGLGGSRSATERGVTLNSRIRPDGRVEWKHHFAHLAAALIAAVGEGAVEPAENAPASDAAPAPGLRAADGWADLSGVTAPLLLIRADKGYVTAADAAEFAERLPAASITVVSAGHNVQEYIPIDLAALIRSHATTPAP